MKNSIMSVIALVVLTAGCGVQEDAAIDGRPPSNHDGDTVTDAGSTAPDSGTPAADAGNTAPTPDAGNPTPDAGSPTPDAGSNPTPDAGSPAPDAGTQPTPDAGTPAPDAGTTVLPDPVSSPSALHLLFSDYYMSGSTCGDVKGNLPGTNWNDDYTGLLMSDTNGDHFLELTLAATPAGTYDATYRDRECAGGTPVKAWAHYGDKLMLRQMRADARQFLNCNWWDATNGVELTVSSPGCNIRLTIDGAGVITGAGNMRNYH